MPLGESEKSDSVQAINRDRFNFAYGTTPGLQAWPVEVVEYYHTGLNQYFSTAVADNIELLDNAGAAKTGWARTGNNYTTVSLNGNADFLLANPTADNFFDRPDLGVVYRFYGSPTGPNTHFYTTFDDQRAVGYPNSGVQQPDNDLYVLKRAQVLGAGNPHKLHIEGMEMRVTVVVNRNVPYGAANQLSCKPEWKTVYRLFNGENSTRSRADGTKIDGNHRFAITPEIRAEMIAKGWVDEGVA